MDKNIAITAIYAISPKPSLRWKNYNSKLIIIRLDDDGVGSDILIPKLLNLILFYITGGKNQLHNKR